MKRLILTLLWCAVACGLEAVPAKRITMTVEQPDGTVLTLTHKGDEFFHYWETEDGIIALRRNQAYYYAHIVEDRVVPSERLAHTADLRSTEEKQFVQSLPTLEAMYQVRRGDAGEEQRARTRAQNNGEVPTEGVARIPILLVQYADKKFASATAKADFEQHLNGEEYNMASGEYGSARKYFEDQSGGKFSPQLDIIGPVTLSKNMNYYGGNDEDGNDLRPRDMVQEACRLANDNTDFSVYDNNGDGYVDFVYVIYAGYGEASSQVEETIWPHQWQLASPLSADGVKISKYACNNELDYTNGTKMAGIGTFCHEFSHCLGLPDFYPTGNNQSHLAMDAWSLMDYGCYNDNGHTPCGYTGYEKDFLGWKPLILLEDPADITIRPLSEGGDAYKVVNDANPDEFYVLENHKKSKWDSYAHAEGMLVLHVDYQASAWNSNTLNNDPTHLRMTVIPADNVFSKNTLKGDTYPGTSKNTELTDESTPAAKVYKGGTMGKSITNITKTGDDVTLSFMKGVLPTPKNVTVKDIEETGFTMAWDASESAQEYEVMLEYLEENPYVLDEDFNTVQKGSHDIGGSLDMYTNHAGWMGQGIYGLDGAIRVGTASSVGAIMSPYFACDSLSVTIILGFKKCEESDKGALMVVGIGDKEWGNNLKGAYLTATNDNWETCIASVDSIGKYPYFYLDTRGDATQGLTTRADIDYLYILPGNWEDELLGETEEDSVDHKVQRKLQELGVDAEHARQLVSVKQQASLSSTNTPTAMSMKRSNRYMSTDGKQYYKHLIHTTRTKDSSFRFDNLDGGRYIAAVRSVQDDNYSRYSSTQEIVLAGNDMLPQLQITPEVYIDKDSLYISVGDTVSVYYTTDGALPTAYSNLYDEPIALGSKMTICMVAYQEGYRHTDITEKNNWFEQGDATYRIVSERTLEVAITEAVDGNTPTHFVGHWVVGDKVEHDSEHYAIVGVDSGAFSKATSLRSVKIEGQNLRFMGQNIFHGCSALNVVEWNVKLPLQANMFDDNSYNNLLLYAEEGTDFAHPLIETGAIAFIEGNKTKKLLIQGDKPFYCPRTFEAETVSYQRSFTQATGYGDAAGWETIVLPFDVQSFSHHIKGEIAPFGVDAKHHFWLSELTEKGFCAATALRANIPYIIAMPNNTEYGDNTISGDITFSAAQATIYPTIELRETEGADFMFVPTYETLEPNAEIYALNVKNKFEANKVTYKAGSVFVPNKYTVSPFSAYVVPMAGQKAMPFYRIQKEADVEESFDVFSVESQGGVVYVSLPEAKTITVYDMTGRQVCRMACEAGTTEIAHLADGIYLIENVKVYVKH